MGITEITQPEEPLELTTDQIVEDATANDTQPGGDGAPVDDLVYDTFDDGDEEVKNPHLVAELREKLKEAAREKAELRRRLEAPKVQRTPKPTLDSCDYDEEAFEAALIKWRENEARADEQESAAPPAASNIQEDFTRALATYQERAQKLGRPDFEAMQKVVTDRLSPDQQSAILMAVKDPAQFIYALGRSPARLEQLALIENPFKLAAEASRIEGNATMARKQPANIDKPVHGSAPLAHQDSERKEKELLAAAEKDPSKFQAYRDYMKEKRKAA